MNNLNESYEDYLKAIYLISKKNKGGWCSNREISEHLHVKPSSVTGMMYKLKEHGLITWNPRKALRLTEKGKNMAQEKRRKIRTLTGNWQLISQYKILLNPYKNPIFFQYISHKLLRLLIPFIYIGLFMSAIFLKDIFYRLILLLMILGIISAIFEKKIIGIPILCKVSKMNRTLLSFNYFAFLSFFCYLLKPKNNLW